MLIDYIRYVLEQKVCTFTRTDANVLITERSDFMIKFSTMTQCVTPDMHNIYIIQRPAGPPRPTRAGSYRGDAGG